MDAKLFLNVLFSILMLIGLALPGYILRKLKMVYKVSISTLVAILLYINQPFLVLKAFSYKDEIGNPLSPDLLKSLLFVFLFSIVGQVLFFVIAKLCFFKSKKPESSRVYTFAAVFGNVGFIGIPFIEAVLSGNPSLPYALLYATVFNVTFNITMWTIGVYALTGDIKAMKPKMILLNPSTAILVVALPLFFLKVNFSAIAPPVAKFIGYLGDMTTPMSMFIVGIRLADMKLKEIFSDFSLYAVSGLKLILSPVIMYLLLLPFIYSGAFGQTGSDFYVTFGKPVLMVLLALSALPAAASTIAFCEKYKADYNAGVKSFMNTTILSVITLPLILTLLFALLPV